MKHFPRISLIVLLLGTSSSLLALQRSANQRNRCYDQGPGYISSYQYTAADKTYGKGHAGQYWCAIRDPQYHERFSSLAIALASITSYIMTH